VFFRSLPISISAPKKDAQQKTHIQQAAKSSDIVISTVPSRGLPRATQSDDETQPKELPESVADSATLIPLQSKDRNNPSRTPATSSGDDVAPQTVDKSYAALLEIVNRLKSQGPSSIEQGDRITTLQISSGAFFGSGSAALSNSGRAILKDVAVNIQSDKYKGYQVTVEGHTDDSPIRTIQFPSNWELSTARAAAVVHFFLQQGIPAQKLRAAGYADTFPVSPNRAANGKPIPENQARNRRVVIKLEKIEKME
jgi:flagellar motor protein MotB